MATVVIDVAAFNKRIDVLQKSLATKDSLFNNADSVFVLIGKVDEENPYRKSSVLHVRLLSHAYFFSNSILTIALDLAAGL
jgi:nucleosome binding factor SPN SPT16 subunit